MATGSLIVAGIQAGRLSLGVGNATLALTEDQARCRHLEFTADGIAGNQIVSIPSALDGMEWIVNNTTGYQITFRVGSLTGVAVTNGKTLFLRCNATDVVKAYDP
jgi:hypothetical protein